MRIVHFSIMPKSCSVIRCNASARMPERKFFRFPMLNNKSDKALALTQTRQDAWVAALNRADFFPCHYKNATVCDRHFVTGKSAKYNDVDNVDWVPTLHLGYQIKMEYPDPDEQLIFDTNINGQFQFDGHVYANKGFQSSVPKQLDLIDKATQTKFIKFDASTQTDDRYTGLSPDIVLSHQENVALLEERLDVGRT